MPEILTLKVQDLAVIEEVKFNAHQDFLRGALIKPAVAQMDSEIVLRCYV